MSTDYRPRKKFLIADLFDGRLEEFGIKEHFNRDYTTGTKRCLTDGSNFLWVFADGGGFVRSMTRWMANGNPQMILSAIAELFDTDIFSEHEPQSCRPA